MKNLKKIGNSITKIFEKIFEKRFEENFKFTIFIVLILFFFVSFGIYYYFKNKKLKHQNVNQFDKGYYHYENIFTDIEINDMVSKCINGEYKSLKSELIINEKLKNLIIKLTNDKNYIFQDYIWIIQKSTVHTCHRDNNGDFFNKGQKYPSYTMIVYLEDMDKCLSIIPNSHKNQNSFFFNFTTPLKDILCKKGDVIIFNANIIHVGTINEREDNIRIQMKITHKDDIQFINYYQNFNKVLKQDNNLPLFIRKAQRSLSCTFPGFSNLTQGENIRTARGSDNGVDVGIFQKIFSYLFYGNSEFYNLPNAF